MLLNFQTPREGIRFCVFAKYHVECQYCSRIRIRQLLDKRCWEGGLVGLLEPTQGRQEAWGSGCDMCNEVLSRGLAQGSDFG